MYALYYICGYIKYSLFFNKNREQAVKVGRLVVFFNSSLEMECLPFYSLADISELGLVKLMLKKQKRGVDLP